VKVWAHSVRLPAEGLKQAKEVCPWYGRARSPPDGRVRAQEAVGEEGGALDLPEVQPLAPPLREEGDGLRRHVRKHHRELPDAGKCPGEEGLPLFRPHIRLDQMP